MPMYEYRCEKCGENFEVEQRMTDDALTTHDECGGQLSKVFSSVGIVWKGQGFYKTDTRGTSSSKSSSNKKSEDKKPSSSSEPKSTPKESKSTSGSDSKVK